MEQEIDVEQLRQDIIDYYGTAMFNGFPQALINVSTIENASLQQLIKEANKLGLDMDKYTVRSFGK